MPTWSSTNLILSLTRYIYSLCSKLRSGSSLTPRAQNSLTMNSQSQETCIFHLMKRSCRHDWEREKQKKMKIENVMPAESRVEQHMWNSRMNLFMSHSSPTPPYVPLRDLSTAFTKLHSASMFSLGLRGLNAGALQSFRKNESLLTANPFDFSRCVPKFFLSILFFHYFLHISLFNCFCSVLEFHEFTELWNKVLWPDPANFLFLENTWIKL